MARIELGRLVGAFAAHGPDGLSTDEVARLAGVAKPTLYAHGHTRRSLFALVVEAEVERLLDRLSHAEPATRGRSARDRATRASHAILAHAAARPDGLRLLARAGREPRPAAAEDPVTAAVARIPERIATGLTRDLLADGLDATLAPFLARAVWGATLALAEPSAGERRPSSERLAAIAASVGPAPRSLPAEQWPAAT